MWRGAGFWWVQIWGTGVDWFGRCTETTTDRAAERRTIFYLFILFYLFICLFMFCGIDTFISSRQRGDMGERGGCDMQQIAPDQNQTGVGCVCNTRSNHSTTWVPEERRTILNFGSNDMTGWRRLWHNLVGLNQKRTNSQLIRKEAWVEGESELWMMSNIVFLTESDPVWSESD